MAQNEFDTAVINQAQSLMKQSMTTNILFLNNDDCIGKVAAAKQFARESGIGVVSEYPLIFDWDKNSGNFSEHKQGEHPEVVIVNLHYGGVLSYRVKCERAFEFVKQTCHLANANKKIVVLASKEQMAG